MDIPKKSQKQTIADQKQIIADLKDEIMTFSEVLKRTSILLANVIELRDPYTKGHSEHVSELTENIVRLGFSETFPNIEMVKMAALLHDVGKTGINETVLNKPTLLTEAEFKMVKSHTILGERLVKPLMLDNLLREAILSLKWSRLSRQFFAILKLQPCIILYTINIIINIVAAFYLLMPGFFKIHLIWGHIVQGLMGSFVVI